MRVAPWILLSSLAACGGGSPDVSPDDLAADGATSGDAVDDDASLPPDASADLTTATSDAATMPDAKLPTWERVLLPHISCNPSSTIAGNGLGDIYIGYDCDIVHSGDSGATF